MARIDVVEPKKIIQVGQRVEIALANDPDEIFYASRIEDFDSKYITIALPLDKGYPIIPHAQETIYGRIRCAEGVYKFSSTFVDKKAQPIPVLRILMPPNLRKHQQREFVRVETMIPLKIQLEDELKNLLPPYYTISKDISGGGIRLVMNREVPPGSRIHIETNQLPVVGVLSLYCEVVRSIPSVAAENIFWIGTKFIDLPKDVQRNLIRFIFQKQRELLVKRI